MVGASLTIFWLSSIDRRPAERENESFEPRPSMDYAEDGEGIGRRDWLYLQRAYPLSVIPRGARVRALEQLQVSEERMRRQSAAGTNDIRALDAQPTWLPLGPTPILSGQTVGTPRVNVSGRVSTVVLDPGYNGTSNQTVYLGAAQGGVWRSRDNGATWVPLTDDQPSLAMGAIAIDPTNSSIIYAGTGEAHFGGDCYFGAGLLKSSDGGATWRQITGPPSSIDPKIPAFLNASFHALVIDPSAPANLYAATEEALTSSAVGATQVVPLGERGIWKSTDAGLTWRNVNPAGSVPDKSGTDVIVDPRQPQRVFAALREEGLYRSASGGEPGTWEKLTGGLPTSGFFRIKLAVGPPLSPSTTSTLLASFAATNDELLGIYRSTDGGTSWIKLGSPGASVPALNYCMALAIDPIDANIIYFGTSINIVQTGSIVWRTKDGGTTWLDISQGDGTSGGLHADTHWIAISAVSRDTLFTANDGGVWRTNSATADVVRWAALNDTLSITQFNTVALHPRDPNVMIGGTQDNGTDGFNGSLGWTLLRGGDGGAALIDQSSPEVAYHTFINRNNFGGRSPVIGPEVSFNSGATWTRRGCFGCVAQTGGFNPSDRLSDYAPMSLHPGFTGANGNVIYFGTHRLYRTADRGVTWTGLGASMDGFGTDLTKTIAPSSFGYSPSFISAISAHSALDQSTNPPGEVVWVGTGDGLVHVTTNAGELSGATFTNVTRPPLPNRFVTDIGLDPRDQRRAVLVYSGFNTGTPQTPGHVFLTIDGGASWMNISGNLPDIPVTSVVVDPVLTETYYIGTDLGAFQTLDGGATWIRLSNGMPQVAVFMLRYHSTTRSLIAATHGRGGFRLNLPPPVVSVSAASFSGDTVAADSIAAAFGTALATATQTAMTLPLPTELAGTRVILRDRTGEERAAGLFFVSAGQINYLIPKEVASGLVTVTVTNNVGVVSLGTLRIGAVAPGLFAANSNGLGVAAAIALRIKLDGTQIVEQVAEFSQGQNQFVALPIDPGPAGDRLFLILFGTGWRNRTSLATVNLRVGGINTPVSFASAQGDFAGLDQINAELPRSLAGRGDVEITLTVENKQANVVRMSVR